MTNRFYSTQLSTFVRSGRAEEMRDYLATLRNANFRTASASLSEAALWEGVDDFWHFAAVLVAANRRAYLGTMLKVATALHLNMPTEEFAEACTTDIDCKKVVEALLPEAKQPSQVVRLLQLFSTDSGATIEGVLLRVGTPAAYFVLFNHLKRYEDQPDRLRRFGIELIRRGDKHSFNLARILQEYFGLAPLPGTFSLTLHPYELSRLDANFDTFLTILNK